MASNVQAQLSNLKIAVLGAFGYIYEYKVSLARALLLPLLLLFFISYLQATEIPLAVAVLLIFVALFIHAIFAITTHRILLLGPESVPKWGMYKLTRREMLFILYAIGLGLLMVPFSVFAVIPFVGFIVFLLFVFYLLGRLSLVFPAIATDNRLSFAGSWEATKQHQLFMLGVVVIFPAIIAIPETLISYVPRMALVSSMLSIITTVFVVAALSMAYKIIKQENTATDPVSGE